MSTKYWKLAARRGRKKALIAVAHKMLVIIYNMLQRKEPYIDLGITYLDNLSQDVKARKLMNQLRLMGYQVQATPASQSSIPEVS